jgi:hypothetical protein
MKLTEFIKSRIKDEPASLLDPAVYSDEEIREDLLDLDMKKQQTRSEVEQESRRYEAKIDEAAAAPEWMTEELLREADDIEREKQDRQDEWRQLADKQRLVKSVQSFRRRIDANERNLNITEMLEGEEKEFIRTELRESLLKHMRSRDQVNELLDLFTSTREVDRSKHNGNKRNIEKHRDRMEQRQNGSAGEETARESGEKQAAD